jgi:hypothetical protein
MSSALVKVRFYLDPTDWHGRPTEALWAEPLENATPGSAFQLRNSPLFVRGVSFLDTIRAVPSDDVERLEFAGVIDRSGHSTFMLLVPVVCSAFDQFWTRLEDLGCSYESKTISTSIGARILYSVYMRCSRMAKKRMSGCFRTATLGTNCGRLE